MTQRRDIEYRHGGTVLRGVLIAPDGAAGLPTVAIHPGLDLLETDWSLGVGGSSVLVAMGAADPMATPTQWQALKAGLTGAGIEWELDLYSGTTHGFTSPKSRNSPNPDVADYHPRNAQRAWKATLRALEELIPAA